MRIFKTLDEMYKEVERELKHSGLISQSTTVQDQDVRQDPGYQMKELIGYSYLVKDTSDRDQWLVNLGLNLEWAQKDFIERTSSNINPGEAWKLRESMWSPYIEDTGKFAYSYSERLTSRIDDVVSLMLNNKSSRQAVIPIYNQDIDDSRRGGKQRVPCSMFYQFLERHGKLDVIYVMRSSDLIQHFPYDVWHAAELRDHIAERIKVEPGDLIHFVSSLHVFYKDDKEIF